MLNFNKKKYVSFDNLKSFNGLLQSSLKEKIDGYKSEINVKVDERFKVLSGQQQKDSEVIDAREGQVSLSENLKTYVKKEEHENLDNKISNQIEEIKSNVNANTEYINTNKSAIQRVIDFVDSFRCEFQVGNEGYIKLPQVMGGFIIQWGRVNFMHTGDRRDNYYDRPYVIPFEQDVFYINSRCTSSAWVTTTCTDATPSNFRLWVVNVAEGSLANMEFYFNWFAIGR